MGEYCLDQLFVPGIESSGQAGIIPEGHNEFLDGLCSGICEGMEFR